MRTVWSALWELCRPTGSAWRLFAPSGVACFSLGTRTTGMSSGSQQSLGGSEKWLQLLMRGLGQNCSVFSPRPHEVRAWASSLAFASNISLSSLTNASHCRSPGTFIHFYLRDVSHLRRTEWPSRPSRPPAPLLLPHLPDIEQVSPPS